MDEFRTCEFGGEFFHACRAKHLCPVNFHGTNSFIAQQRSEMTRKDFDFR